MWLEKLFEESVIHSGKLGKQTGKLVYGPPKISVASICSIGHRMMCHHVIHHILAHDTIWIDFYLPRVTRDAHQLCFWLKLYRSAQNHLSLCDTWFSLIQIQSWYGHLYVDLVTHRPSLKYKNVPINSVTKWNSCGNSCLKKVSSVRGGREKQTRKLVYGPSNNRKIFQATFVLLLPYSFWGVFEFLAIRR